MKYIGHDNRDFFASTQTETKNIPRVVPAAAVQPTRGWGRSSILVAEVALAAMLLLGAGPMMRSLAGLYDIDPGFDDRQSYTDADPFVARRQLPSMDLAFPIEL